MKQRIVLLGGVAIFFFFLTSCASTKLTSVWHDAKYDGSLHNVMVVGVSDDGKKRKVFEDVFVEAFKKNGIKAISSLDVIPSREALDKDTIKGAALEHGIEAILVTHLIRAGMQTEHGPPPTGAPTRRHYGQHSQFGTYYGMVSMHRNMADYSDRKMRVSLQNNLYDTDTEKLIWAATSESVEPKTVREIVEQLTGPVMKDLRANGLIQ
jgi:hypothetical protein